MEQIQNMLIALFRTRKSIIPMEAACNKDFSVIHVTIKGKGYTVRIERNEFYDE